MPRLLMLAYHFPPDGVVGAARSFKFARYLPEFGWDPIVLAAPEADADPYDDSHRDALRMPIRRVRPWPGPRQIYRALRSRGYRFNGGKQPPQPPNNGGSVSDPLSRSPHYWGVGGAVPITVGIRTLALSLLWLPDDRQGWFWPGVAAALRAAREGGVDAIWSTGPPWTAHLVAATAARVTKLPWVADFRDPWACGTLKPSEMRSRLSDAVEQRMERWVLGSADRVVVTAPTLAEQLHDRYPWLKPARLHVISNGFDPADSVAPAHARSLSFIYGGSLYGARDPRPFLTALRRLVDERRDATTARVLFIGGEQQVGDRDLATVVAEMGLSKQVAVAPARPHACYLELLAEADVALLFFDTRTQIPAKLFDALGLAKPVLAFGDTRGPGARIVAETGLGRTFAPYDSAGIERHLRDLWDAHARGAPLAHPDRHALSRHDVRARTADLARLLAGCARTRGRGDGSDRSVRARS